MANNFPTIKPSLNLQFANTGALPPDVTFTRASSSGGYYDGKTVAKAEENLLLRSQEFDNAYWQTASNVTITANSIAAPDGTTTAETMTEVATTATHRVSANNNLGVAGLADQTVTLSCFIKAGTRDFGKLSITNITGLNQCSAWFDVGTGAVGTVLNIGNGSGATASISAAADGWYRCVLTGKADTSSGAVFAFIAIADADNSSSYLGDVTKDIYIWGAQLEQRSSVTAYTPTTTQPITNYIPKLLFAPAGVPVFDHNPTTGEALGLSVWESRTNELPYSEDYVTGVWGESRVSLSDGGVIDVRGGLNSVKMTENTENNSHFLAVSRPGNVTSGVTYTISVYLKANNSRYVQLTGGRVSSTTYANFDLVDGVVAASGSGTVSAIESVGNGWFRCSVRMPVVSTGTAALNVCLTGDNPSATRYPSYEGDGISSVIVFGPQWETGAFPTPYIPTVGSTVTRSADLPVMTGANFSRWFRADEGTLVIDFKYFGLGTATQTLFDFNDNTTSNRLRVFFASNELKISSTVNGTTTVSAQNIINPLQANVDYRLAIAAKDGGSAWSHNGVAATDNTSRILGVYNRLTIGNGQPLNQAVSAGIKSIQYYPARLTNDNLVAVTQ